jgi:hypothetical protein
MNSGELVVGVVAATVIVGWFVVSAFRRWLAKPVTPDPWGAEVTDAINQPEAVPVCLYCQCPHEPNRWFCAECGHAVGDYNTVNPYLYIFSLGEVLREGTSGNIRKSWLTVTGLVVLSLVEYFVLAPIYWFFLFRNLSRKRNHAEPEPTPPAVLT